MKTCTNGLPCPTQLQCGIGCFFNDADTPYSRAMNAPLHSRNGGNVITDGAALKPVYDGDDEIDEPMPAHVFVGLVVCGLLWLAAMGVLVYRII